MKSIKKHAKKVVLFTVFFLLIALAITYQTEFPTDTNIAANFTVELTDAQDTISNINSGTIQAEKLKEKPISVKTPHFEPLQYLNIHNDNVTNSSVTIRILNEWNRSDLTIYHYAGDDWQSLETRINGSYLEAVTYSFSVFAVGTQGGININLMADDFTFLNNTATIAGAAFYNNSTAAAGIFIEINPAWSGYANTTTDTEGNFIQILTGPSQPGNYKVWVNATAGSLNSSNYISINATNATLYRINASANIAITTGSSTNTNISFTFPVDAVPESANLILNLGSSTNTEVKVNNITIYNGTTDNANLNLIGYFDTQNEINITTGTSVTHTYDISFNFHTTKTATITQPSYYSAYLPAANSMSYDWNNSNITFHLPDGAYGVTVWENTTDLTSETTIPARGGIVGIKDDGIGTIYNNSPRNFYVNYSLEQVTLNVSIDNRVAEKLENVYITPYVYYNGSQIDTITNIKIYRDDGLVEERDGPSGTPFAFSTNIAGVYNISATASPNIDGVVRTGTNHTNLHIKDLLIYLIVDPTHSGKPINVTGRAYYTDCTAACDQTINLSMDGGSWSTTTNATGHFNYSLPGKTAGSYVITANLTTGNYSASTNATVDVLDEYFYVIKGDLPTVNGEKTLSPSATVWINHQNITRASIYIWGKTSVNLTYNPYPYPIIYAEIPDSQYSYLSGTFNIPLYPYDYLEIQSALLNTTANVSGNPNVDFSFNITIDDFPIFSDAIGAGDPSYFRSKTILGYVPSILKPGNVQTIRVYKRSANSQQYYFTEEINVRYIGHVAEPHDLYFKVNNNFMFAKMGDIPNATVDVTGFREASNSILINNDITSIIGYNLNLQKRYFGYTAHSETKLTSRYNVTDTAVFTPEADLTSVTVLIPLMDHAKDVKVFVNNTNVTDSAIVGVNMELPLSEINTTKVINISYWVPILDITPSVNNTQFNRGDTAQIIANITFNSEDVSGATVYANITKAGIPIANLTLTNVYGGVYSANYTVLSNASLGVYDVKVWAYNDSTAITSNDTTFKVRGLNVSLNAGGPYVVDNNAIITGYIRDLENNSLISGATVNITISNSSGMVNQSDVTSAANGSYSYTRAVDLAGIYNVSVNTTDLNGITGTANDSYEVKYDVSLTTNRTSCNSGDYIEVNISVHDKSSVDVSTATVTVLIDIPGNGIETMSTGNGRLVHSAGNYSGTFTNTTNLGLYSMTVTATTAIASGDDTGSVRVSTLSVTEYLDKTVYIADDTVYVWGSVYDNEAAANASGASYNVSIWRGAQYINSNTSSTNSTGWYSVSFPGMLAGSYDADVDVIYDTLVGSNTTPFEIRYNVSTAIPKSLYGINEQVDINISVFDTGPIPVIGAVLTVNITNSSELVTTLEGSNITDNANGYYTTNFTPGWSDDFNISVHVENGSVIGDAALVPFRATGFYVDVNTDRPIYEAADTVYLNGLLWDSLESPRHANVTIKVFDSQNIEIENETLSNQFDNYSYNFNLDSSAFAGTYSVEVNASEIESGGSLTASNSTTFNVEYIVTTSTNRSEYNTNDSVNVTVNVKNGTSPVDTAIVNINVTNQTGVSIWSGIADGIGSGNYSAEFPLINALLGDYTVEVNISNPWVGDANSTFTVRELNITSNLYGPYNLNGTHNGPLVPLIISGTVNDSELNTSINNTQVNISISYPNNSLAAAQVVTTNGSGLYSYNFTSSFSSTSPAGLYNVSIQVNDSGITNIVTNNFTVYTVEQSWATPARDFRMPLMLNNTDSPSTQNYSTKGFVLTLPGGVSQSSILIKDITSTDVGYSAVWDNANTLNITLDNFSLDMFEGRPIYVYFDRDNDAAPDSGSVGQASVPLVKGTVEGYWIDITKDSALYTPLVTARFTANLTLTDSSPLGGALINFTIYDPNGNLTYGPQNNVTDPSNISQTGNSAVLNYSIPAVKGLYSITVNATSQNGIPRTESSTFNVGGLLVGVETNKLLYNTRENVLFTINLTDLGTPINGATVKIDVNDESGVLPYEFQDSITTNSSGIAETIWNIPTDSALGNYSITVNVNTTDDTGYNGSQTFRIDRYELGLTTNTEIIGFNEPLVIRGNTTHNYTNVDSYANVSVIYQNGFIDDVIPYGSIISGGWNWDYNFKHSGMRSHYQEAASSGSGSNQHYFLNAYSGYRVGTGEDITFWVFIDPDLEPVDEIMLQLHSTEGWGHRAYWGPDLINYGTGRISKGSLPAVGQWVELNVSTTEVGLDGLVVDGVAFSLNENSSNTAKVWFDDVHFSGETTHDSYLENQNVTSSGGSYVAYLENDYTEIFNDPFTTFNATAWTNTSDTYLNASQGYMVLEGTGSDWNAQFYSNDNYARSSHPVMKADFKVNNLNSYLHVSTDNSGSGSQYRRFGMRFQSGDIVGQRYDPVEGFVTKVLFTPVVDTWYTAEIHFYDTHSTLYVYSRDDNSRPKPDIPDYEYNLSDWNPRFHFWAYNSYSYIDNARVDMQSTYDTLTWVGEYIVISNSSYANLSRSNVTGVMVADLNVTVGAGGPHSPSIGNVTISGQISDNRSGVDRVSDVLIYVVNPLGTNTKYSTTSASDGTYSTIFSTPQYSGTYQVRTTANDSHSITGDSITSFRVRQNISVSVNQTPTEYDLNEHVNITVTVYNGSGNVPGCAVTINITKPDVTVQSFTTPGQVTDNGDGTYSLVYTGTDQLNDYDINVTSTKDVDDDGEGSTTFRVRSLKITIVDSATPYIVGDSTTISGSITDNVTSSNVDGDAIINVTYPRGEIVEYGVSFTGGIYSKDIVLNQSGRYSIWITANDTNGVTGISSSLSLDSQFLVIIDPDMVSYEPGDNATITLRAYNGTGYEPVVDFVTNMSYGNNTFISSNPSVSDSNGTATSIFTLPNIYNSFNITSTATKGIVTGYNYSFISSANLRMWMDPAEALVGHSTWPVGVTPIEYRNLTINAAFLNSAGHFRDEGTITAKVYRYDGNPLGSVNLTESNGVYSGIYTVLDNGPEGRYWFEIQEYPGIKQYFNVVEWGCTRCHIDFGMSLSHYYAHAINSGAYGSSDGPVYPSNFTKEYVHEVHPIIDSSPWGIGANCNNHGYHKNGYADQNCVKCHPTEVLPSACPDCHNSANNRWGNILSDDYGVDIHAGINRDVALGKSAISSYGGYPIRAVDNDEKTAWVPDGVANQLIEVNLSNFYIIDGVRIAMSNYKATYSVDGWEGSSWISLVPSTTYTNYGNDKNFSFAQNNVSKVRLTVSAWNKAPSGGTCWGGDGAATVTQQPEVKSINVYMPNDLPITAANPNSHIACQSCHGGDIPADVQPTIPKCTDCHPYASGSGMQVVPESIRGSTKVFEDFEDIDGWQATSGFTGSSVAINTNTTKVNGTYSGQVDYTLGIGYGRIYIDKTNLELTNATKISIWVYGDNSDSILTIGLNNNKNSKIDWHWSTPITIDWIGWREVSININELSQRSLMYISGADTVRIKLEKWGGGVDDSTILIDELIAVKVGSHTEFDDVECGVCHGSMHDLQLSPQCNYCHQTQDHGWPTQDKYPGDEAQCMICHETGVTENLLNVSNISLHADHIEDFENISIFTTQLTNFNLSDNHYSGLHEDTGNHSAVLNYTNLVGYLGNSLNITNGSKYKGISVFVNATSNTNTTLILGVYTDTWYNYTRVIDWTGWKEINIIYHNDTVNETRSFNATGDPTKISFGVNGTNSNGSIYFDDLRQAVSDDYHQYVSWKCTDCHTQTKNLPGITDITSPITDCSLCHNQNEPHFKQFTLICMDCHFESGHGDVDPTFTDYEKASTCLKCHTQIHDFNQTHLESYPCSNCHDLRVHGQNAQLITYNESIHLTCERCHGKATAEKPLPLTLGNPGSIFLRLSYTYNNETQCNFCHQNRSNAYILHTNLTVNESNIDSINDDTICTSCHDPIPSITNISDRDELTAEDNQREPHAQQILGHGNVSCYKCHGHRPETLTLTIGQDCVGCHQDPTELVELAPGKINKSSLSNVTNPGALQLIVISPQTTGHGNTSCAECHGHTNSNLTSVGSDSTSCTNCHENTSSNVSLIEYRQPNSPRSNITGQVDNTIYVTPPQVVGHGNTSCIECHDHAPSSFLGYSIVGGTNCAICHQNTSTNVTLIENTIPASANTGVVDNSTSIWIVHAPQVVGHGQADCSICHSHNVENLVYNGGKDNDCITCHYNESSGTYLLQNGSYVVPPQVVPHNDLNCSECHSHTPNSMTHGYGVDCRVCHQNTTKAQSLTDTYGIGLNLTLPAGNISAVQIPALNHSTGVKWNKTTAYWTNDSEACQYCHKISTNYSNHNPLGRVSVIAGTNQKNSTLIGSYWCAACHYENYSSGSVTFDDSVELFLEANLPVPPEVAANTTYGNYTYANDGLTKYYNHILSDYSDAKCAGCHGESDNTKEFVHHVVGGFASCIGCHDYGDTNSDYRMNNTDMKLSVHANLNSNASNSTGVHADNKKCWGCHTSDGQEPIIDMGDKYTDPYTCMECHNTTSKAYYNVSNAPAVYNHFGSGEQRLKQMGNDTLSCMACHNKDEMKVNFSEDDSFRNNRSVVSHYAKNYTPLSSLRNYTNSTQYCIFCHDNDTSIFNIFVTEKTNHGSNCSVCHGAGRIHDELSYGYTPSLPSTPGGNVSGCLGCHADANSTISEIYLLNMTMFNDSVHFLRPDEFNCLSCHISVDDQHPINEYTWKWCECCHVVQNDPINDTDRHNVTNDPLNYIIGVVPVVNITDCTVCHDATAYNASVDTYTTNKCRYCHEYADKGNKTSQSWY